MHLIRAEKTFRFSCGNISRASLRTRLYSSRSCEYWSLAVSYSVQASKSVGIGTLSIVLGSGALPSVLLTLASASISSARRRARMAFLRCAISDSELLASRVAAVARLGPLVRCLYRPMTPIDLICRQGAGWSARAIAQSTGICRSWRVF